MRKSKKTIPISEFKAKALGLLEQVASSGIEIVVSKRGKPLARVVPYRSQEVVAEAGQLAHLLISADDIVSPLGAEEWLAAK